MHFTQTLKSSLRPQVHAVRAILLPVYDLTDTPNATYCQWLKHIKYIILCDVEAYDLPVRSRQKTKNNFCI